MQRTPGPLRRTKYANEVPTGSQAGAAPHSAVTADGPPAGRVRRREWLPIPPRLARRRGIGRGRLAAAAAMAAAAAKLSARARRPTALERCGPQPWPALVGARYLADATVQAAERPRSRGRVFVGPVRRSRRRAGSAPSVC